MLVQSGGDGRREHVREILEVDLIGFGEGLEVGGEGE